MKKSTKWTIVLYSYFTINVILLAVAVFSVIQIWTPSENYIKKYIIDHKSEMIQSNDLFGGEGSTFVLKTDHHYIDDITINVKSYYKEGETEPAHQTIYVIAWANRDKVNNKLYYKYLWHLKSDKSFYLTNKDKLGREVLDILTPKTKI